MASYKATRNLLIDIPAIEKTAFLIDRKDLDDQITMVYQSYTDNGTIDVEDTEYVDSLIKKMTDDKRQMIVTNRQEMQIMVNKHLKEETRCFDANRYEQKGDLPQTTEWLYGKCLHSYTIKEAIHERQFWVSWWRILA